MNKRVDVKMRVDPTAYQMTLDLAHALGCYDQFGRGSVPGFLERLAWAYKQDPAGTVDAAWQWLRVETEPMKDGMHDASK